MTQPSVVVPAKLRAPRSEALARDRLDAQLAQLWSRRLCLVVAPAGSGKTTLLARLATTAGAPVAWYRADNLDGSLPGFLGHLQAALSSALGELPGEWTSVADVARGLEAWDGERALLVIDDFHTLEGTPAERALERLVDYAPAWLALAVGSRSRPALNLSRLRVAGDLLEVGGEDLRFRSWEVERLFRDFYGEPLPPTELATLAHKTEGWAAGLQLFHLATSGKPAEDRRRILASLDRRFRFLQEYLAGNVLDQLPAPEREFLVRTCPLGRLSAAICDRFIGRTGSDHLLRELDRRQIFLQPLEEEGDYRYHEVLRSHLEAVLLHEVGEEGVRELHRRSAGVLEEFGALPEALRSYSRAEDWSAVDRLLGGNGEELAQGSALWIDALPPFLLDHDPWLLLAGARRHRAEGRWSSAVQAYQRAELAFAGADAALICHRERLVIGAWLQLNPAPAGDAAGVLRAMVQRDPRRFAPPAGSNPAAEAFLHGMAALLDGSPRDAARCLQRSLEAPDSAGPPQLAARLGLIAARLLAGERETAVEAVTTADGADQVGQGFLARLARIAAALRPGADTAAELGGVRTACEQVGDGWGAALADLAEGWAGVQAGAPAPNGAEPALERAATWFRATGAEALEAWPRALLALLAAVSGDDRALATTLEAERLANARGVEGPKLFTYLALTRVDRAHRSQYAALAATISARTGLVAPEEAPTAPRVAVRLFGGFELTLDGDPVDLRDLRPRARTLLRLLCVHADRPVHRGAIQFALWPDADPDAAARNLLVAMSSVRQALRRSEASGDGREALDVVRDGDAYRLLAGAESRVDLLEFERAAALGRRAREAGDPAGAIAASRTALDQYQGDLLPEDGVEEWVAEPRERTRALARETAARLAELLLDAEGAEAAAQACLTGLRADRFDDRLWRLLIVAHERAGDRIAAQRARESYHGVLAELGLPTAAV